MALCREGFHGDRKLLDAAAFSQGEGRFQRRMETVAARLGGDLAQALPARCREPGVLDRLARLGLVAKPLPAENTQWTFPVRPKINPRPAFPRPPPPPQPPP